MTFHVSLFDSNGKYVGGFSWPEISTAIRCAAYFSGNLQYKTKIEVYLKGVY